MAKILTVAIILAAVVVTYVIVVRTNKVWIFNRLMLLGAVLGIAIFSLVSDLIRVAKHRGPGYVTYGDENHDDVTEKVSEGEYKLDHFTYGGLVLLVAVVAWIYVARTAAPSEHPPKGK